MCQHSCSTNKLWVLISTCSNPDWLSEIFYIFYPYNFKSIYTSIAYTYVYSACLSSPGTVKYLLNGLSCKDRI